MEEMNSLSNNPANSNGKPLIDVPTAAEALCISVRFLRQLIAQGEFPAVRLGKRVLVRRRDIEALVDRGGIERAAG